MTKKLSFAEFRDAIKQRSMPTEILRNYVQFDPDSPIPKLSFRSDALTDQPDTDYDVDGEIYQLLRQSYNERDVQLKLFSHEGKSRVVAEGDSWFCFPSYVVFRSDIVEWIRFNNRFSITDIAYWGHTLKKILQDKEYLRVISNTTDYFMLSAGGNDLQEGLANGSYLHSYEPDRPMNKYLTPAGEQALTEIKHNYQSLLNEVISQFSSLKVLTYGYDYPRPLVGGGTWIGRHLQELEIPDNLMTSIMACVLDRLNMVIKEAGNTYEKVHYLDCRHVTTLYPWHDDMHPSSEGFGALASKFEEKMNAWNNEGQS